MVLVYTQQKEGRPILAVGASGAALGLAMIAALGVVSQRHRIPDTELGQRIRLEPWPISVRSPAGWNLFGGVQSSSRMVFVEGLVGGAGRQIEIQRIGPRPFLPPSFYVRPDVISRLLGVPASAIARGYQDLGPRRMGEMPGALIEMGRLAVQVGVSPSGHIYKFVLDNPTGIRPGDLKLLSDMTATVELHDPPVLLDPAALWEAGPYRFDAPQGTRYSTGDGLSPDRIICFGDPQEPGTWQVETALTFLAPGRSVQQLLRDFRAGIDRGIEPSDVESGGPDGGEYARYRSVDEDGLVHAVAVRRVGPQSAAVLRGIADQGGRNALEDAEKIILATMALVGAKPDLSRELERGQQLAQRVRRDFAGQWSNQDQTRWFLRLQDNSPVGFFRVTRLAGRHSGDPGYLVDALYSIESGADWSLQGRFRSFVSATGNAAALTARGIRQTGGREHRWDLREDWEHGSDIVDREWSSNEGTIVRRSLAAGPNYLPDPLPEWAYYVVAAEAAPDEAFLICTSGLDTVHDTCWVRIEPLAGGSLGDELGQRGLGALIRYDFDPEPERWYFDARGGIRELWFGSGQGLVACSERDVYSRFRRAGRIIAGLEAWWD